jgi:hypothetical protein
MKEMNSYIFVGKPEGKAPRGRPRRRGKNNTGLDFREIEWEGLDWMHVILTSGGSL